jgi:regulator of protease activity HflC (stomatin/prohibitin superfamily)
VQRAFFDRATAAEGHAAQLLDEGRRDEARAILHKLVDDCSDDAITAARQELQRLTSRANADPIAEMATFWDKLNEQAGVPSLRPGLATVPA